MDVIKKVINIDAYKSHTPCICVPFIKVHNDGHCHDHESPVISGDFNTSWGDVLCDSVEFIGATGTDNVLDILSRYFHINEILRRGTKMVRVTMDGKVCYTEHYCDTKRGNVYKVYNIDDFKIIRRGIVTRIDTSYAGINEEYVNFVSGDDYDKYVKLGGNNLVNYVERDIIGLLDVPSHITGVSVPDKFHISKIPEWLNWFDNNQDLRDDKNCCGGNEWEKRGGDAMWTFLRENISQYTAELEKASRRLNNCSIPKLSIPVLLTQNYDDIGTMSIDDTTEIPYKEEKMSDWGHCDMICNGESCSIKYHETRWDPIQLDGYTTYTGYTDSDGNEHFATSESMLSSLRSKTKDYDEQGNLKPFIDDGSAEGKIPYVIKEAFNVSYDADTKKYSADYIEKITYVKEDGTTSETITNDTTGVTFEYVSGGPYTPSSETFYIQCNVDTVDYTTHNISPINIKAYDSSTSTYIPFVVVSNCDWFKLMDGNNIFTGATGSRNNLTLHIDANKSLTSSRVATISIITKNKPYETAMFSILQEVAPPPAPSAFEGPNPDEISVIGNSQSSLTQSTMIKCIGSDWYVKSKPDFVKVEPTNGSEGILTSVTLTFDTYNSTTGLPRKGNVVFAAITDGNTATLKLTQSLDRYARAANIYFSGGGTEKEINNGTSVYVTGQYLMSDGSTQNITFDDGWTYEVLATYDYVYADMMAVTLESGMFKVTNNSSDITMRTIQMRVYNKEMPDLNGIVTVKLVKTDNISIRIEPTETKSLAFGNTKEYKVTVTGDVKNCWNVDHLDNDYTMVIRKSDTSFTLKNKNLSNADIGSYEVYVKHNQYDSVHSNSAYIKLIKASRTDAYIGVTERVNYNYPVSIDIWPESAGDYELPHDQVRAFGGITIECSAGQEPCGFTPERLVFCDRYLIRFNRIEPQQPETMQVQLRGNQNYDTILKQWTMQLGYAQYFERSLFTRNNNEALYVLIKIIGNS